MELKSTLSSNQPISITDTDRWEALITSESLVLVGLGEHSLREVLLTIAGRDVPSPSPKTEKSLQDKVIEATGLTQSIRVEKTVTIQNKSAEELYSFWHNFENLPTFMKHLKSVNVSSDTRSHWIATAPLGQSIEWDAEILSDRENQLITWASVEGADVDNSGFVRFKPAPPERGTEVKVVMEYSPIGGGLTAAIAKLFGEEPQQQIGDDLRLFKMLMEAGEIATTEGQPTGHH